MRMKKINIASATNIQLDWLVAKCEGVNAEAFRLFYEPTEPNDLDSHGYPEFHYSTVWAQGGPIIEREKLEVSPDAHCWSAYVREFLFEDDGREAYQEGPTPLIAAARCYVTSKLGKEVEVPEELP